MKHFKEFGIFLDASDNGIFKVDVVKDYAKIMAKLGYNKLYLGTSETFKMKDHPYFGYMKGSYSQDEIREMDAFCDSLGIELIPAFQTLGHLPFMHRYDSYAPIYDTSDILLVDEPKTYEFIESMFKNFSQCYKTKRYLIGMDEAYLLGGGKYQQKNGPAPQIDIFLRHLNKVADIAKKYGIKCEMWSDVFFHIMTKGNIYNVGKECKTPSEWKKLIPDNVNLIYWEYFIPSVEMCEDMIDRHRVLDEDVIYAGSFFRWYGMTPCNTFTNKVMKKALKACANKNVERVMITSWTDFGGGSSIYAMLPSMWYLSRYTLADFDESKMNFDEFKEMFGVDYHDFALLDTPNRPYTDFKTKEISDYRLTNISFIYLFNDPFYGLYDSIISENISSAYKNVYSNLMKIDGGKYQFTFDLMIELSKVLEIKADLGKRILTAYKAKDLDTLSKISNVDIPELLRRLTVFFVAYKKQWFHDYKGFGWEVPCLRVGALEKRLSYVKETIDSYLSKEIDKIEELEEEHLPFGYSTVEITEENAAITRYSPVAIFGFIG